MPIRYAWRPLPQAPMRPNCEASKDGTHSANKSADGPLSAAARLSRELHGGGREHNRGRDGDSIPAWIVK